MAGSIKRNSWGRYGVFVRVAILADSATGPAHAVYFGTYEIVKKSMGGNELTEHHPLAAGAFEIAYRQSGAYIV